MNSCKIRISDGLFEIDSPNHLGNQSATAEYVLSVNEKVQSSLSEFGQSFIRYLQVNRFISIIIFITIN